MPEAIPHFGGYRGNQGNKDDAVGWRLGGRQDGAPHERAADAVSVLLDEEGNAITQGATQPRSGDRSAEQSEHPRFVCRVASLRDEPVQPTNLVADSGNRLSCRCEPLQVSPISV